MNVVIEPINDVKRLKLSQKDETTMVDFMNRSKDVWTGSVDGKVACVWGIAPPSLMSNRAYMWLYTTDLVKEHQFTFVRRSQIEVEKLLETYDIIAGHCVAGSKRSMRWLKWLGATFSEPEGDLVPFQIRKKHG